MLNRVNIDRFVRSAVDCEIGLPVTVQILCAESDATFDRLFENSGRDDFVSLADFSRKPDID